MPAPAWGFYFYVNRYAMAALLQRRLSFRLSPERLIFYLYNGDIYRYHTRVKSRARYRLSLNGRKS